MSNKDKKKELKRKFLRENMGEMGFFSDEIPMWKQYIAMLILAMAGIASFVFIVTFILGFVVAVV